MEMYTFWGKVLKADMLTRAQVINQHPNALEAAKDEGMPVSEATFAFSVIPNLGPSGPTTDEDEVDFTERDPNEEIDYPDGPSVSGDRALMAYFLNSDEVYVWHGDTRQWLLWNY